MPAAEETTGDPAIDSDPSDLSDQDDPADLGETQERAEAGTARSPRRNVRRLIVPLIAVILAVVAVRGATLGQDDGSGGAEDATTSTTSASGTRAPSTAAPAAGAFGEPTTSSSVAPPDVARPRPAVDLTTSPDASDMVEVARWWAATFVAYVPAEQAADLVARLEAFTTPDLQQALLAVPPAASYDAPEEIVGASAHVDSTAGGGSPAGAEHVRVIVETPRALAIYEMVVVPANGAWQVAEANRV